MHPDPRKNIDRIDARGDAFALKGQDFGVGRGVGHETNYVALMRWVQAHSCDYPAPVIGGPTGGMSAAAQIRAWMKDTLAQSGMTVAEWSARSGVAKSTIHRAMKPDYEFVTSSRTLAKLANASNSPAPKFNRNGVGGQGTRSFQTTFLPVRYKVQAGNWVEVDGLAQAYEAQFPVAPDPRYAGYPQWLEEVVGDSIDQKIPEGGFAHVVDAIELGYAPREGDFVVVERRRDGGQLRERTIKQVAVADGKVQLWPRSNNPRWQAPMDLAAGASPGDPIEVEIVGLVIGAYSPF